MMVQAKTPTVLDQVTNLDSATTMLATVKTATFNAFHQIDTSSLSNSIYQDVVNVLEGLAMGLKTTAVHVYNVFKYQYFVKGLIVSLLFLIVIVSFFYHLHKLTAMKFAIGDYNPEDWSSKEEYLKAKLSLKHFYYIGFTLSSFIFLSKTYDLLIPHIMMMLNPEYFVITDIIQLIKDLY